MIPSGARFCAVLGVRPGDEVPGGWTFAWATPGHHAWSFRFRRARSTVTVRVQEATDQTPAEQRVGIWDISGAVKGGTKIGSALLTWFRERVAQFVAHGLDLAETESLGGLSCFEAAMDTEDLGGFFAEHWGRDPCVVHGDPSRLGELYWEPRLANFGALKDCHRGVVLASSTHDADNPEELTITRESARALWDAGWVVTFLRLEKSLPILKRWCDSLLNRLGVLDVKCGTFSARPGFGVPKHWDAEDLICIQLHGTKTWWIAPNEAVPYPTANCLPPRNSPDMADLVEGESLSTAMPEDAQRVELKPGSVLYLPGGWWHTTEDGENALSLSFAVTRQTRLDKALQGLRKALIQRPEWRAPMGTGDDSLGQMVDETDFASLIRAVLSEEPTE
jgi:hypothetical protein